MEYALILLLIVIVTVVVLSLFGNMLVALFQAVVSAF